MLNGRIDYKLSKIGSERALKIPKLNFKEDGILAEADLLRECKSYLDDKNIPYVRVDGSPKFIHISGVRKEIPSSHAGFPDLMVMINSKVYFIELKSPLGGSLSDKQIRMHEEMHRGGAYNCMTQSFLGFKRIIAGEVDKEILDAALVLINQTVNFYQA